VSVIGVTQQRSPAMSISTWATGLLLAGTVILTFAALHSNGRIVVTSCIVLCAVVAAAGVARALPPDRVSVAMLLRWSFLAFGRLLSQLSPVILLSVAYPLAAGRLSTVEIGGLAFPKLVLATSVTAPWLSQIVCMPIFSALSPHAAVDDARRLCARALEAWPWTFAAVLPVLAILAVPVCLTEHWQLSAALVYATLCLLNAAFAQSLVYSVIRRHSVLWLAGWAAYAAALLLLPQIWFLPPLAGLSVQVAYLVSHARTSRLRFFKPAHIGADLAKGAMLGCLLWSDKYLYLLRFPHSFNAALLFGAMVPAIVAYNFYFAMLAPRTDSLVKSVRQAMDAALISRLRHECDALSTYVRGSVSRVGLICSLLSLMALSILVVVAPYDRLIAGCEMLACWCFVMGSVACYKLAYIGQARLAYSYGALHLLLASAAFALSPSAPYVYLTLAVIELLIVPQILRSCMRDWDQPEFMLFWRHALRW
jgi:hypothetical protein